jgi:beta-1,2-mannobiose phosphorylase / 1,2-beta-oligomannan phosphorylase
MKILNKNLFLINSKGRLLFFFGQKQKNKLQLKISESGNGTRFSLLEQKPVFKKTKKTNENLLNAQNFNVSNIEDHYFLTYEKLVGKDKKTKIFGAYSKDLIKWECTKALKGLKKSGVLVPDFLYDDDLVRYTIKDDNIGIAYSENILKWREESAPVIETRDDKFDNHKIVPANVFIKNREIILFYYHIDKKGKYSVGFAILNYDNPEKVTYRCDEAIWEQDKNHYFDPLVITEIDGRFALYWQKKNGEIYLVLLPPITHYNENIILSHPKTRIKLKRIEENPVISPIPDNSWEALAAFNPTVFDLDGKVHILYRAMGHDAISSVGYAVSSNGINIDKRYDKPIYVPRESFEGVNGVKFDKNVTPRYMSGGGWGGCEDARATVIKDRLYIMYAAFDGYNEPNVAFSSISLDNFRKREWSKWDKAVLLTNSLISTKNPEATEWTRADRPGIQHTGEKDAAVLPEKINGKYVVFHRIWPNIVIDFVDDLNFDGKTHLRGEHLIKIRPQMWDSAKICLSAAPIKTDDGWLLIYNAVDKKDSSKYKIGAMLLDLNDPRKVVCRCSHPILEPEEHYENGGLKHGIVFAGGAIIRDGTLFIYYGGSDEHSCIATYNAKDFLRELKADSAPHLVKVKHD